MDYHNYSVNDFIKDEAFQRWVFSPDEKDLLFWENFELTHPHKAKEIEEAKRFLRLLNFRNKDTFEYRISLLKKKIDLLIDNPEQTLQIHSTASGKRRKLNVYSIAASVALMAIMSLLWLQFGTAIKSSLLSTKLEEYAPKGERNRLILEDGSSVWLNSDSRLEYPKTFKNNKLREVYLDGEAYFDIVKSPQVPFVVHTSDITIKVLGTAFNVKSYIDDPFIETTLVHGNVSIAAKNTSRTVHLQPNQQARFIKTSKEIILQNQVDTTTYVGWKNGMLIFDEQPFSQVKDALERWYNITIHIQDRNSLSCTFSARFNNESLEEVLELFKTSESINYSIEGDQVYLSGKLCEGN